MAEITKSKFEQFLLFEFKIGHKASEATCNINSTLGQATPSKRTVRCLFRKFGKGEGSLENEEGSGRSAEVDNDQLRAVLEADPPTSMQEVAEELSIDRSMVVQHLKQIGEVMKLC